MGKSYAGIGSRETPEEILALMFRIGYKLAKEGWVLRSGGAQGADSAFQSGVESFHQDNHRWPIEQEIYLPWAGFCNRYPNADRGQFCNIHLDAEAVAKRYHPAWSRLSDVAKKLMCRNGYQILGKCLDTPVRFVIAWTRDGSTGITTEVTGGTGQALRIAYDHKIPIFNLALNDHKEKLVNWIER